MLLSLLVNSVTLLILDVTSLVKGVFLPNISSVASSLILAKALLTDSILEEISRPSGMLLRLSVISLILSASFLKLSNALTSSSLILGLLSIVKLLTLSRVFLRLSILVSIASRPEASNLRLLIFLTKSISLLNTLNLESKSAFSNPEVRASKPLPIKFIESIHESLPRFLRLSRTLFKLLIFLSIDDVSEGTSTSLISLMNCVSFLMYLEH